MELIAWGKDKTVSTPRLLRARTSHALPQLRDSEKTRHKASPLRQSKGHTASPPTAACTPCTRLVQAGRSPGTPNATRDQAQPSGRALSKDAAVPSRGPQKPLSPVRAAVMEGRAPRMGHSDTCCLGSQTPRAPVPLSGHSQQARSLQPREGTTREAFQSPPKGW